MEITRNDVLAADLSNVVTAADGCVVTTGVLADPYTGSSIDYVQGEGDLVDIDHLYPLALAWDHGASQWDQETRTAFANDQVLNLLAVDAGANRSKGDDSPSQWLPPNTAYRCTYAVDYTVITTAYGLTMSEADSQILTEVLGACAG